MRELIKMIVTIILVVIAFLLIAAIGFPLARKVQDMWEVYLGLRK